MNKRQMGLVAVAAFLTVEFMGASAANAQGRIFSRMRGRFSRATTTQCCNATTTCGATNNCNTQLAAAPVSYNQPVSCAGSAVSESPAVYEQSVMSLIAEAPMARFEPVPMQNSGYSEAMPAVGCNGCGGVQPASYVTPVTEGEYFGGDSGCVGCQSNVVQGCVSGDCGSISGQAVQGEVIQGEFVGETLSAGYSEGIVEGGIVVESPLEDAGSAYEGGTLSPSDATSVPEPPAQAPDPVDDDKDA